MTVILEPTMAVTERAREERLLLHQEIQNIKQLFDLAEARLNELELRIEPVESAVAKIPSIEARLGRVDKMLLELQFNMKRFEASVTSHNQNIEAKLDSLIELIKT